MKGLGEAALAGSGWVRLSRWRVAGRAMVLLYHNVVSDELVGRWGDTSLHIGRSAFARHLDHLCATASVVPLEEILEPGPRDDPGPPRVAVTFDDAYRGALTEGVEELRSRGLPAAVFVAPGLLGDRVTWWDGLASPDGRGLDPRVRHSVLTARGDDRGARMWARRHGLRFGSVPSSMRAVGPEELERAVRRHPLRVAAHTWSHPNLPALSVGEVAEEMARTRRWLRARFGDRYLDVLAYPYGRSGEREERLARRAGYRAAFSTEPGWLDRSVPPPSPFRIPRLNVPSGLSSRGLAIRLARP